MEEQRISVVYWVWNGLKIKRVGSPKSPSPFPLIINFPFWKKTDAECVYSVVMPHTIFERSRQLGELGKVTLDRPKQMGYHAELWGPPSLNLATCDSSQGSSYESKTQIHVVTLPKLRDKILTFGSILQELWAVTVWKAAYSTKSTNPLAF